MDDREVERRCVDRRRAPDRFVRAPTGTRDDRRAVRDRETPQRDLLDGTPDEVRAQLRHASVRAVLDGARVSRPFELTLAPDAAAAPVVVGSQPCAPVPVLAARPEARRPRSLPVQRDHVEPRGRSRCERAFAVQGHVARHERHLCGGGRCASERNECGDEKLHPERRPSARVAAAPFGGKGGEAFPDRIFTTVKGRLVRGFFLAVAVLALAGPAAAATQPRVLAIRFGPDLEINPVTQDYFTHQLNRAAKDGYDAAVIELDTPGGLSSSMKTMYQAELRSKIPVIVYVSPEGARAASAGVWISQAADVLAMAPTTNIGSSTPIDSSGQNLGSDLRRKVINDAAASLTALASAHKRNTTWPAEAVKKASNLTAEQALDMNVIDVTAPTLPALLKQLDGYKTKYEQRPFTLHLANAAIDHVKPGFFTRLLNTIIDPNILSLLFNAGIFGLGFEVLHPGVVLPGALGGVALLTALFGFSVLPISWAGLGLIVLGIALLAIDAHVVSHGALTLAGLVSLAVGMLMLFHNAPSPYKTSLPLVLTLTLTLGAFWAFALTKAVKVRRQPVAVDETRVIGEDAVVRTPGQVLVAGEIWHARHADGGDLIPGDHVRVEGRDGLELTVR